MNWRSVLSLSALLAGMLTAGAFVGLIGPRSTAGDAKGAIYAQLSSAVSQMPKGPGEVLIAMESNDAVNGIGHSDKEKTTDIIVKTPGVYFVMAAAQVGRSKGESNDYVDLWVKQNGKGVDNSNTRQALKDGSFTTVLVCQGIAECKAGDVIQVAMSASSAGKGLGVIATRPEGEPVIPSIIFSMYKIN